VELANSETGPTKGLFLLKRGSVKRIMHFFHVGLLVPTIVAFMFLGIVGQQTFSLAQSTTPRDFGADPSNPQNAQDEQAAINDMVADLEKVIKDAESQINDPSTPGHMREWLKKMVERLKALVERLKKAAGDRRIKIGRLPEDVPEGTLAITKKDGTIIIEEGYWEGVFSGSIPADAKYEIMAYLKAVLVHEFTHTQQSSDAKDGSRDTYVGNGGKTNATEVEAWYTQFYVMLEQLKRLQKEGKEDLAKSLRDRIKSFLGTLAGSKYEEGIVPSTLQDRLKDNPLDTEDKKNNAISWIQYRMDTNVWPKVNEEANRWKEKREKSGQQQQQPVAPGTGGWVPLPGNFGPGTGLVVAPGGIAQSTTFEVWRFEEPPAPDPGLAAGGPAFEFFPATEFAEPAVITLPYEESADPDRVDVYVFNPFSAQGGVTPAWEKVTDGRSVDVSQRTISVRLTHLSLYMPLEESPPPVGYSRPWLLLTAVALTFAGGVFLLKRARDA
jgi:hypothetical protein